LGETLIVVDYTVDFVADDGALTCGRPGQAIEGRISALASAWLEAGCFTVMALDRHDPEDSFHPENQLFPPHNVAGTPGRSLYGRLEDAVRQHRDKAHLYEMDKTRYSAFAGTDLDMRLRERRIDTIHLAGVCTDICVLHTAVEAYNLGYSLVVHADAVQSFDPQGHQWALGHFQNVLGAEIREQNEKVEV